MKGDDIARRLLLFAVQVLLLVRKLQRDSVGRHVGRQLMRSATGGGANYEESRSAESRADFAHKVSIAAKELRESRYWLRLAGEAKLAAPNAVDDLTGEAGELIAILTASAKTAKSAVLSRVPLRAARSAISVRVLGCLFHISKLIPRLLRVPLVHQHSLKRNPALRR